MILMAIGGVIFTTGTGLRPCITLCQEHITVDRTAAIAFQPSDSVGDTILTLSQTQVPDALSHTLYLPGPTNPIWSTGAGQRGHHSISAADGVRVIPIRRSTFLQHHSLVLHP